jgi:hypothetical protein
MDKCQIDKGIIKTITQTRITNKEITNKEITNKEITNKGIKQTKKDGVTSVIG